MNLTSKKILIKNAKIIDPSSSHHLSKKDILINNVGKIDSISDNIKSSDAKIIKFDNLHVSKGWTDINSRFGEPGKEYKEDLLSGLNAAAQGGYTHVALMPSTEPCIQSKLDIKFLINETSNHIVNLHSIGALTKNREGNHMTEMFDMYKAGAIGFGDDKKSISNAKLMKTALLYLKTFNGLMISYSSEEKTSLNGQINEGIINTKLGLKGIPSLSEEIQLARDLQLCEYTQGRIHFSTLSSKNSFNLIREAKKKGLNITCDVSSIHTLLDDSKLESFNTNLKILPPLRDNDDIKAIKIALKDGTIDAISSNHNPQNIENKQCEFNLAAFGMINLETSFAAANKALHKILNISELIEKFTTNPQNILNLRQDSIEVGSQVDLTLFDPSKKWSYKTKNIVSKSKNSGLINKKLLGKPIAVIYQNNIYLS